MYKITCFYEDDKVWKFLLIDASPDYPKMHSQPMQHFEYEMNIALTEHLVMGVKFNSILQIRSFLEHFISEVSCLYLVGKKSYSGFLDLFTFQQ